MKKTLCFFLCGILLLALAACGGGASPFQQQESPSAAAEGGISSQAPSAPEEESSVPDLRPEAPEEAPSPQQAPSAAGNAGESSLPSEEHSPAAPEDTQNQSAPSPGDSPAPQEESLSSAPAHSAPVPAPQEPVSEETDSQPETTKEESAMDENTFYVRVGDAAFAASFAETDGAQALKELLAQGPVTISMSDYGGFEKVGSLGQSLPASNSQTTTQAGDIVLYQGNQIVLFYGSNSWSYTRLGKISDLTGWEEALGGGDISVTFSLTNG